MCACPGAVDFAIFFFWSQGAFGSNIIVEPDGYDTWVQEPILSIYNCPLPFPSSVPISRPPAQRLNLAFAPRPPSGVADVFRTLQPRSRDATHCVGISSGSGSRPLARLFERMGY